LYFFYLLIYDYSDHKDTLYATVYLILVQLILNALPHHNPNLSSHHLSLSRLTPD